MDLSIIIVNWNSVEYLKACIASVRRETSGIEYEIVVIDSGSFDGCDAMLESYLPRRPLRAERTNLGFGRANNWPSAPRVAIAPVPESGYGDPRRRHRLDARMAGALTRCRRRRLPALNSDGSVQSSCVPAFPTIANQLLDAEGCACAGQRSGLWGIDALFATDPRPRECRRLPAPAS